MIHEKIAGLVTEYFYHRPKYPDQTDVLKPEPYLRLPFTYEDLSHWPIGLSQLGIGEKVDYTVSEGWYYSRDVTKYIPYRHAAVDFKLPYKFRVVAPCDGYAISSYYSRPEFDSRGKRKQINGNDSNFGIGYFVQIYNPYVNRFIQLGHLSDVHESIPFSIPVKAHGGWEPTNHKLPISEFVSSNNPNVVPVKTGDVIGYVGYSGLSYEGDYKEGYDRPYQIDPNVVKTWSTPHIHMDEFQRNYVTGKKDWRRDPYDIYAWRNSYPTHTNNNPIGNETLFLTDANNRPYFADT